MEWPEAISPTLGQAREVGVGVPRITALLVEIGRWVPIHRPNEIIVLPWRGGSLFLPVLIRHYFQKEADPLEVDGALFLLHGLHHFLVEMDVWYHDCKGAVNLFVRDQQPIWYFLWLRRVLREAPRVVIVHRRGLDLYLTRQRSIVLCFWLLSRQFVWWLILDRSIGRYGSLIDAFGSFVMRTTTALPLIYFVAAVCHAAFAWKLDSHIANYL